MKKLFLSAIALLIGAVMFAQFNDSNVLQVGALNGSDVNQTGLMNDSDVVQLGALNGSEVDQIGAFNYSNVLQIGAGNGSMV